MPLYIEIPLTSYHAPLFDGCGPMVLRIPRTIERNHRLRVAASLHPSQSVPGFLALFGEVCLPEATEEDFDTFLAGYIKQGLIRDKKNRQVQHSQQEETVRARSNLIPWSGRKQSSGR